MSGPLPDLSQNEGWLVARLALLTYAPSWLPSSGGPLQRPSDSLILVRASALTQALQALAEERRLSPPDGIEPVVSLAVRTWIDNARQAARRENVGDARRRTLDLALTVSPAMMRAWLGGVLAAASENPPPNPAGTGLKLSLSTTFSGLAVEALAGPGLTVLLPPRAESGSYALAPHINLLSYEWQETPGPISLIATAVTGAQYARALELLVWAEFTPEMAAWYALASATDGYQAQWAEAATQFATGAATDAPRDGAAQHERRVDWTPSVPYTPEQDRGKDGPGLSAPLLIGGAVVTLALLFR